MIWVTRKNNTLRRRVANFLCIYYITTFATLFLGSSCTRTAYHVQVYIHYKHTQSSMILPISVNYPRVSIGMINISLWPQSHKVKFKVTEVIAVFAYFWLKINLFENFEFTAVSKRRSATIHEVYLVLTWRLGLCCRCLPLCSHREARDTRSNWEIWVFAYVFTVCEFSALYDSNDIRPPLFKVCNRSCIIHWQCI